MICTFFKYSLNTTYIHIYIKFEKDLIDDPQVSSFLLIFWKRSSKEKNMWFWLMNHVMNPAKTLLDTKSPPLLF